jgi:hypothetical protein
VTVKRHCDTCDATDPRIPLDGWLHLDIEPHLPFRAASSFGVHGMLVGDYCSPTCLVAKMLSIPGLCQQIQQTVHNHMEVRHEP